MVIKVTKEHIRRGVKGKTDRCPLALAIREATGNREAWVDNYKGGAKGRVFLLNEKARKFVRKFDNYWFFRPRPVTLELPI